MIKLEKQFYETFRMAVKQFITQYKNIDKMKQIDALIDAYLSLCTISIAFGENF